jgi:Rrf2 family protein
LARRPGERWSNQQLAATLRVSEHHLAKVMQQLARAGIASSTRGPRGGFQLDRPPEQVTLIEVFEAVEGPVGDPTCLLTERLCDGTDCLVGELVRDIHERVRRYLAETPLARLADRFPLIALDRPGCSEPGANP